MAKCNLGKVKLETCWPAVYHVGCPTRSQGPLVAHVLAVPALPFSRMIAHQSQLLLPPPSPLGKYVPCCSPLVVQCDRCLVLGGHRVAMDTATLGWYSIWWPLHHQAPTPHAHQSMSLPSYIVMATNADQEVTWMNICVVSVTSWLSCPSKSLRTFKMLPALSMQLRLPGKQTERVSTEVSRNRLSLPNKQRGNRIDCVQLTRTRALGDPRLNGSES